MSNVILEFPLSELPKSGEKSVFNGFVMYTESDDNIFIANAIELSIQIDNLKSEVVLQKKLLNELHSETVSFSDAAKAKVSAADELVAAYKEDCAKLSKALVVAKSAAIKAEKVTSQTLSVNKNRSERITKLQKEIGLLKDSINKLNKKISDLKKPVEYNDTYTVKLAGGDIVIQLHEARIHLHDVKGFCVISTQAINDSTDWLPVFLGRLIDPLLKHFSKEEKQIQDAINHLAGIYRQQKGRLIIADLKEINVSTKSKIWLSGVKFLSEIQNEFTLQKISELPGIGKKTIETIKEESAKLLSKKVEL